MNIIQHLQQTKTTIKEMCQALKSVYINTWVWTIVFERELYGKWILNLDSRMGRMSLERYKTEEKQ